MSVLLQINGIRKRYGAVTILEDATASFTRSQRLAVIGRNGAGKSTLCRIITGEEEMDAGTVTKNSALRLGYLKQYDPFKLEEPVLEFLTRYTDKEPWQCSEVAGQFQLKNEMLEKPIAELAGGYRTRVKLAAMLLEDPNFLVLDEPTNYLDLSTLILLENFLQNFNGGYLIVSHDREFLKRTCTETLEVDHGRVSFFPGPIEEYFEFKEERDRQIEAYNRGVEKKKEQLQEFVDRFKARASTATRAKSKMKQMARLKTIEILHGTGQVRIRIPEVENKTGAALWCEDLNIGYPGKAVASGISLEINRGAHVAILGENGQGKTTFLRTIAANLQPLGGSFRWGTGLKVAYYAQHVVETMDPKDDIYAYLRRGAPFEVTNQDILNMAGCFLFKGDEVRKKLAVLSGGERARLCLASLLLTKSQVLLLDEPTNHLDFETVEALGTALKSFSGTIFFISHDRTFVNLIATSIVDIKSGTVGKYPGTYEDYVYHLEVQARGLYGDSSESEKDEGADASAGEDNPEGSEDASDPETAKKAAADQAAIKREIAQIQTRLKKLESRIQYMRGERDRMSAQMAQNPFFYSKDKKERFHELKSQIEDSEALKKELEASLVKLAGS